MLCLFCKGISVPMKQIIKFIYIKSKQSNQSIKQFIQQHKTILALKNNVIKQVLIKSITFTFSGNGLHCLLDRDLLNNFCLHCFCYRLSKFSRQAVRLTSFLLNFKKKRTRKQIQLQMIF